jgi:hypothetical protein
MTNGTVAARTGTLMLSPFQQKSMKKMKSKAIAAISLAVGLAFGAGTAMAQATSGSLVGDAKPGDVVLVGNQQTSFSKEVKVKENGKFRVGNLTPGEYVVAIRHEDGSMEPSQRVRVNAGASVRVQPAPASAP